MNSLRRWLYRPKCQVINEEEEISGGSSDLFFRTDSSLLAQFYFADEDLNQVAAELDSFEGRKDPERCTTLVNQLRACQARVLNVVSLIMDEQVKDSRASRDFRVKFPDDVIQENLAGQLWFGAECLAAGSSIMNREVESACMRPLARALTKNLDSLRNVLREQCLRNVHEYTDSIKESLIIFDKLFAEFELSYVSAMVPVKTAHEYDLVQEITVLFSETVQRALKVGLLTRDMIDEYDPALMFTIPRLAIVSGVHIFKDGPLNPDNDPWNLSEMFRPFQTLLLKIRELLGILTDEELNTLERALCSQEEPSFLLSLEEKKKQNALLERQKSREERNLKAAISRKGKDKEESDDGSIENEMTALEIAERLEALALNFETSRNAKLAQSNEHSDHEIHNQSSESLSTSSCSFYSEAEVEERRSLDAERELGSDHSGQTHLQQFTQQLYHEINVDSSNMTDSIPVEERNAFSPEFTEPLPTDVIRNSASVTEHSTSPDATAQDHSQIDNSLEAAAVGRAHFAMNKCDSNDSGLHSEVLSNSDSTFTISSSDSNQHVAISDVPGASECPDYRDTSDAIHGGCTNSHSGSSLVDHTQQLLNEAVAHNDCKDSSDTLILVSEVAHQNIDLCLNVPTGAGGDSARASNSDVGKMTFPSFQPDQGMTAGDIAGKYSDSTSGHPNGTTLNIDVYSTVPDLCCENSLRLNTDSTTLQALPETSGNSTETIMQAPGTADTHADHIASYKCRMNGSASGEVVQTTQELTSMNSSHEVIERSCSEHSRIPDNSKDQICDRGEPTDVFNNRYASKTTEERQTLSDVDSLFPCSNSDMLSIHSTVPPAVIEDRENNNNHVKKCAILSQNSDVHSGPNEETVSASAIRHVDGCVHILISGEQCVADPSSEPVARSQSPSASITTTKSDTTLSAKTADSTHVVKASIDVAQDSGKLHPAPPPSHNGILNHVLTTNTSSPSAPKASTTKGNYSGIKGSSRARSLKKSSKLRQQRQETSSSHNHRPGLPSQAKVLIESQLLDSECNHSSETSSYTSDCGDQEEIDLAIKAAENATRQQVRARFESSSDMIHRLFVCISGVADQLQTNFAGDLRNILRAVFDMNCSELVDISPDDKCKDTTPLEAAYRAVSQASRSARRARSSANHRQEPPSWVPDEQTTDCMSCQVPFTFVRRRHHCRNCGKIFCSRCSSNFVPLLHFGQEKAVRVCNRCFMFQVTPFTVRQTTQ